MSVFSLSKCIEVVGEVFIELVGVLALASLLDWNHLEVYLLIDQVCSFGSINE